MSDILVHLRRFSYEGRGLEILCQLFLLVNTNLALYSLKEIVRELQFMTFRPFVFPTMLIGVYVVNSVSYDYYHS